jgi:hypothetical protein
MTSNMEHLQETPPAKAAADAISPSPCGNPSVHADVNLKTSPCFSPPGPSLVQTARLLRGSTFKSKGRRYRTSIISDGTESKGSIFILACNSDPLGGISTTRSKYTLLEDCKATDRDFVVVLVHVDDRHGPPQLDFLQTSPFAQAL